MNRRVLVGTIVTTVAVCGGLLYVYGARSQSLSTDEPLILQFNNNRNALDAFMQFAKSTEVEEVDVTRPNWRFREQTPSASEETSHLGALKKAGVVRVVHRESGIWVFMMSVAGWTAMGGRYKGLAYCETPPSPVTQSLDADLSQWRGSRMVFRHLDGNWYLYLQH